MTALTPAQPGLLGPSSAPEAEAPARLFAGDPLAGPTGLADHLATYGALPLVPGDRPSREALIAQVDRAGLTGRGGAAFPTAIKLSAVAASHRPPVVVANGTEGEPASAKDKVLLARSPHLVLDGVETATALVGAAEGIVVAHPAVAELVETAVLERRRAGIERASLRVIRAAERFVGGEASAVVHWIARGVPTPTHTPPRLSERGLHHRPTLVQNVETLAHLALVVRFGSSWFREVGTAAEPGTMLVTALGALERPGVYEVPIGLRLEDVLANAGGLVGSPPALLLGGYFGSWVGLGQALDRPFSKAGLAPLGAGPGAGLVAVLPEDVCGLSETARVARYLARESAGQCGPCMFGLPAIADEVELLASEGTFRPARLAQLFAAVEHRGACAHPDGAVRLVRSSLSVFAEEIARHARGRCTAPRGSAVLPTPAP